MATNKNAIIRYQALDRCFRNPGKNYYIEDLIEACNDALYDINPDSSGVKRRQVYDDIKFMKDSMGYNAPIESYKNGKQAYYRYEDLSFSINNQPINEQEAQQLRESIITLSRFKGLPQFEWIEDLKVRLEQSFNLKSDENVLTFEENQYLTGRAYIGDLYNAIVYKKALKIEYKPFSSEEVLEFELHPYHLKQYNNRWFLFGRSELDNRIKNLPLDRIVSITDSKIRYKPNTEIDFNEYFEDVIGVTVYDKSEPQKIVLKVHNELWPYFKTKPLHGSQKVKEENGDHVIIELEVIINYELRSIILSHGCRIEVVKPEVFRREIADCILKTAALYSTCAE